MNVMETRCRLCAECYVDRISVLENSSLSSKIFHLFQIKITNNDRLPTTICQKCYDLVQTTWEFNDHIQKAQEILNELANTILSANEYVDSNDCVDDNETSLSFDEHTAVNLKCEFEESNLFIKAEDVAPILKITKTEKKAKKSSKKKDTTLESLPDLDEFDINPDGSLRPKSSLIGWDAYPWTCSDCHQNLPGSEDLRDHFAAVHSCAPRYLCADCPKIYTKYSTFLTHIRTHRVKLKYCCDVCNKWFNTVSEQEKHRSEHGDERPHVCSTCGKRFRMQSALIVHARSHLPAELKNRYQCDQCPKRFGTKPNLMAHKRIHTGIRDYTCDQCGKSFVQKGNLDNHLLTHNPTRPFNCGICGKTFKTLLRLKKHDSVHSGLKPHKCDVCGRTFRERGTLKEHHRIHTGAMPFTCEFCGKCFRFKGVLTTHRRQHTGERPYSCNECQHHFTNWPNYNKHMKRRHGINTSVTCRTRQDIPPTGMPHRNPPGTVLAPPQPIVITDNFVEPTPTYYPVLSLYNIPEELLQQRV
ncbi:unnamed protein product [Brassicogethes aeneus]|uniref:Uncharacterized protein n=1 Tax=Brassicogethes aeneus TaxID=1431903 RepID=A0A9P0B7T1_BRAAE|nr:unnamed protein product [Brassicogethes aeneus]